MAVDFPESLGPITSITFVVMFLATVVAKVSKYALLLKKLKDFGRSEYLGNRNFVWIFFCPA